MIQGMLVSGFMVRALRHVEGEHLAYGLFPTVEAAEAWRDKMTVETVIEAIYAPTFNRG
jgi:hypothetical protein